MKIVKESMGIEHDRKHEMNISRFSKDRQRKYSERNQKMAKSTEK
jgi:hypothetical protein